MKTFRLLSLMTAALALTSCATMFGDNTRQVSVKSNPAGAPIYLNNQYMGVTPTTITLNNIWNTNVIEVRAKGHPPVNNYIDSKFQPIGALNIFFPPAFIIDAISGDMMKIPEGSRSLMVNIPPHKA